MITLFCRKGCPTCEPLAEQLEALAIKHRVTRLGPGESLPDDLPADTSLPALVDDDGVCSGAQEVLTHLEELEEFKEDWYRFQSDACYCSE